MKQSLKEIRTVKTRIHAAAGGLGFLVILTFWSSTVISELAGSAESIAAVKQAILWGMALLIPCLALAGATGMALGRRRKDVEAQRKKKRMPFIALNGLTVLVPSAFFLADRAADRLFDTWFYGVQVIELTAGAVNLTLIGLNIHDGLRMARRRAAPLAA